MRRRGGEEVLLHQVESLHRSSYVVTSLSWLQRHLYHSNNLYHSIMLSPSLEQIDFAPEALAWMLMV